VKSAARIAIIVLFGILCSYAIRGAELIEVTASVDKQTAYIGDLINYSISITYDSTLQLTPPAAGANLGGFEVKEYDFRPEETLDDGRRQQIIDFQLRTFTTGDYVIPALPIEYMMPDSTFKYISADPIKINIKSILSEGVSTDSLEPRPNKGQVSLAASSWTLWLIIGLVVVLVAGAAIYYYLRKRKTTEEIPYVDPRPAWEIAFADLAILKNNDLPGKGEIKQFYFELSEIIKKYLGKKFEFGAIDMTTTEIDEALSNLSLDGDWHRETMVFMEHADLVKFAKYVPPAERPETDWETAYELVSRSKDMIPAPTVEVRPEPVMAGAVERDEDADDSELRFAPPELREYFSSDNKEDN
jgi:hypothetical protein